MRFIWLTSDLVLKYGWPTVDLVGVDVDMSLKKIRVTSVNDPYYYKVTCLFGCYDKE